MQALPSSPGSSYYDSLSFNVSINHFFFEGLPIISGLDSGLNCTLATLSTERVLQGLNLIYRPTIMHVNDLPDVVFYIQLIFMPMVLSKPDQCQLVENQLRSTYITTKH